MQQNCPESCHKLTYRPPQTRKISDDDEEFYELSVKEASTGRKRSMEDFEGYVTVIVNAARVCGKLGLRLKFLHLSTTSRNIFDTF